jgi:hypothetical protein
MRLLLPVRFAVLRADLPRKLQAERWDEQQDRKDDYALPVNFAKGGKSIRFLIFVSSKGNNL